MVLSTVVGLADVATGVGASAGGRRRSPTSSHPPARDCDRVWQPGWGDYPALATLRA